jgi:peptidoglycan/LPS O-acetylase OafA/YrhL
VKPVKSGYIPSLDGWRSIAILGVLFAHDSARSIGPVSLSFLHRFGGDGVPLFFAISGILICTRLLEEESRVGRIDLKGFYIRRAFRIQPAAWSYLAMIALLTSIGWIHEHLRYWLGAIFLYRNFQYNGGSSTAIADGFFTGHFWTLAVEEHFYLLLSLLLVSIVRYRLQVTAFVIIAFSAWNHFIAHTSGLFISNVSDRRTDVVFNLLLIPAFYAVLLQRQEIRLWAQKWMQPWLVALAAVAGYALLYGVNQFVIIPTIHRPLYMGLENYVLVTCPFMIIGTMLHSTSWTTWLLELPPVRFLGKLSYSLYLWHVLFFFRDLWPSGQTVPISPLCSFAERLPWKYVCSIGCAMVSFYFVERPMMRMGHTLAPPATPGRDDLGEIHSHTLP